MGFLKIATIQRSDLDNFIDTFCAESSSLDNNKAYTPKL